MPSGPKLMELRPNRSLLNSDFDGYKLSLAEIPTITKTLEVSVDRLKPDLNQYSLLHAKLFSLHNNLTGGQNSDSVYFINKELSVQKFAIDPFTNQLSGIEVWKMTPHRARSSGDYNISMKFASDQFVVIGDGTGFLHVLDQGCSNTEDKWKLIFSGDVIGHEQSFVVTDAVYKNDQKPELHLILTSIKQTKSSEKHSTVLYWVTLQKSEHWNQTALRELTVNGYIQFANLERSCEAIYVVSDAGCTFTLDSENQIKEIQEESQTKKYKWSQGNEDVTIKFVFPATVNKNLVNVTVDSSSIKIQYDNNTLLEGPLLYKVDSNMTTWTVENSNIEVVLQKEEVGLMWSEVVVGDDSGEYISDPNLVEKIHERLAPLTSDSEIVPPSGTTFNSQQIEECDFECDRLTVFERLSRDSHDLTHKINLGSHQVLLTVKIDEELPLALAVRSDVDALIFQPKLKSEDFVVEHEGTLLAMGYIQASKQQMKFFACSPDLSCAVISESTKHLFIYCQNKSIGSSELRNRTTGKRFHTLAQQQVYRIPSNEEILGIHLSNSYLYILGESFISALKL